MALPPSSTAPPVAQRAEALQARRAFTAGRDKGKDDVVALGDAGDYLADLGDNAGAFVAAECGQPDRRGPGRQVHPSDASQQTRTRYKSAGYM
jgi:hypothetical protein